MTNPYEAPKEPAANSGKAVKRRLGAGAIILLTPVAVAIAFGVSCTAADAYVDATLPRFQGNAPTFESAAWFISALLLFLLPPVATLAGMLLWVARALRQGKRN